MQDFNQQALSNTLWAYAILRHHPGEEFLDAAAEQILHRLGDFNAQVGGIPLQSHRMQFASIKIILDIDIYLSLHIIFLKEQHILHHYKFLCC